MNKNINMPSSDVKKVVGFGLGVVFVVFVLIGGWMAYAPLAASSVAVGKVSADLNKKTIQHLEGGIVEAIYVKDGDAVKTGDILIKLQDIHIQGQLFQINNQIEGLESLVASKKKRLISIKEEIVEWTKLFKEQLVDKLRIRELQREENTIEGDIANTQAEIAKLKEQIIIIKDVLSRTKILAPTDGVIVGSTINTIGGVIAPGKPLLEIVPEDSKLLVIAQVQISDIDKVKVGLLADIRFSAFNLKQAHVIEGEVIHVSADSFIDEVTGAPYYEAKIQVTNAGIKQLSEYKFKLVAGMPAEVMIQIGERTTLSYLVKPFTDMLSRGFNEE
ncbi:MAG: HlyD family efflux transporter periplasmic adaptor subunit [Arcobacteraceae bacterium]